MLLTESSVNAIAIVGVSMVRVWRGTRKAEERRTGEAMPVSLVDAYLLLEHMRR